MAAKAMGVRRMTLTAWELGQARPHKGMRPTIAAYLGYDLGAFS